MNFLNDLMMEQCHESAQQQQDMSTESEGSLRCVNRAVLFLTEEVSSLVPLGYSEHRCCPVHRPELNAYKAVSTNRSTPRKWKTNS